MEKLGGPQAQEGLEQSTEVHKDGENHRQAGIDPQVESRALIVLVLSPVRQPVPLVSIHHLYNAVQKKYTHGNYSAVLSPVLPVDLWGFLGGG